MSSDPGQLCRMSQHLVIPLLNIADNGYILKKLGVVEIQLLIINIDQFNAVSIVTGCCEC